MTGVRLSFRRWGHVPSTFGSPTAKRKRTRQDAELGVNRGSSPLFPNPAWPVSRLSAPAAHRDTGGKACRAGRIEARCAIKPPSKPHRFARPRMPAACRRSATRRPVPAHRCPTLPGRGQSADRGSTLVAFAPYERALPQAVPLLPPMLGPCRHCQPDRLSSAPIRSCPATRGRHV